MRVAVKTRWTGVQVPRPSRKRQHSPHNVNAHLLNLIQAQKSHICTNTHEAFNSIDPAFTPTIET
jgi:hypothetical protein